MTKLSQTGMELLLDHQTQTLITESTWWASDVVMIILPDLQPSNSTLRSIFLASINKTEQLNQLNSQCSKTGIQRTPWRKSWLESKTRWSKTRNFLNQLMEICIEILRVISPKHEWNLSSRVNIAPFVRYAIGADLFKNTQTGCSFHYLNANSFTQN